MSNNQLDFSKFGKAFQEKLAQLMFSDRQFADQLREVLDLNFFELKYIQVFCRKLFEYRDKYDMYPSASIMGTILRTELEDDNDALNKQVRDYFARIISSPEIEDEDYIKDTSLDFCRRQKIKEALVKSAGLMNKSNSLDEIGTIVSTALKLGTDNNYGYDYKLDFEKRFLLKDRNPVSSGWERVDKITQGGLGRGELGVVVAPTGAGKSMALVHLGAMAVKAGLQVVHYTLELSDTVVASRYDSCLTGVPLTSLMDQKEMILEEVKNIKGKLIIKEYPTKTASTSVLKNHIKRVIGAGQKVDMIIVDYGDLLKPCVHYKEKRTELETIYEELRAMAQEFVCPVWTASQTNRSGLNAEVVTMESISEAFNKCFVADFICSVSRTVDDKKTNSGRLFIAKNRNGPDGIVMPLYMDTSVVKMEVLEDIKTEEIVDPKPKNLETRNKKFLTSLGLQNDLRLFISTNGRTRMATKFLRKIILEELKNVLKEEEKHEVGPRSGNFTSATITQWARNDNTGKNKQKFLATDPNDEESIKSLMASIYGSDFQNAYNNTADIEAFRKKFIDAKEAAGDKGQWIDTGPASADRFEVPQKLSIDVTPETFNVATSGKWGVKCKNAIDVQATVRSKVKYSDTMTQDKKDILIGIEGKRRGRLGDGIMGASTLSVINYAMKKNNLGKGFAQFPLNLKGAKMACNDKYTVPQVISALEDIDPNVLASFYIPKGQGIESSRTAVAQADKTSTAITESKILEKRILRELAKMLGE